MSTFWTGTLLAASILSIAACQTPALGPGEVSSGDARAVLASEGTCVAPIDCPAPVLRVAPSGVVLSGITGDVPVSVVLSPSEIPDARVNDQGLWQFDVSQVPPGRYLLTLVVSGAPLQVLLDVSG